MLIWSNIVKTVNNKLLEPFLCWQRRFTLPTGLESYELLFYSIHTWNYKLGDSLLKINEVVTKLLNVYVARKSLIYSDPPERHAWECVRFSELKPELPLNHPETKSQNLCVSVCMRERVHLPFSSTLNGLGSPALTQILSYSLITRVCLQPFS